MGRWGLFERCSRLREAGEPEDNQQSTFAHTHTSLSHSTTSPWSPNPYLHCDSTAVCFRRHPKTIGVSICHHPACAGIADLTAGFHRCLYVAVTDVSNLHAQTADAAAYLGTDLLSTTPEDVWTAEVPPCSMRRGRCAHMAYWPVTDVSGRHAQTTHARAYLGSAVCFPRHPKTIGMCICHHSACAVTADLTAGFHRCLYVAVIDVLDRHAQTADAGRTWAVQSAFPTTRRLLDC